MPTSKRVRMIGLLCALVVTTAVGAAACNTSEGPLGVIAPDTTQVNPPPTPPPPTTVSVASVTISPASATVDVGATRQLTATPLDGNGNVLSMTGRTVVWSSDATSIASVGGAGLVTAAAVGSAGITVTVDSIGANAQITVNQPPPQSSNEPSGFNSISTRPFDGLASCGVVSSRIDGWDDVEGCGSLAVNQIPDGSNGGQASVLVTTYPAGFAGGTGSGVAQRNLRNDNVNRIYISLWIRLSQNFQGHKSNTNKMFFVSIANEARFFISAEGKDSGSLEPQLRLQGKLPDPRPRLRPNVNTSVQVVRGQWQRWELLLQCNQPGASNGQATWWINGVRISDYSDIGWVNQNESCNWDEMVMRSVWGGVGDTVSQQMTIEWDSVYISGSN